ncbi:MAG: RNA 3'-terminal phosphate cyclase [Candidatus Verstraetearchaeota archaeon]|nr:RNA 3'-terminal phosphate cyclase [Candidatus Verstraetearchaeota archaeon]
MIEIDGSYGEGGGQILRGAVFLSCITGTPVKVSRIRGKRPNPGLQAQHLVGLKAAAAVSGATLEGAEIGSCEVKFSPGKVVGGEYAFDVGTAGSTMLIAQELVPILAFGDRKSVVRLRGGTDVPWSPPVDYFKNVSIPAFQKMGVDVALELIRRGHYPRGGGEIILSVSPAVGIMPIRAVYRGEVGGIRGISHCTNLPTHVASRQASAAERELRQYGYRDIRITTDVGTNRLGGPGSGITLWADTTTGIRVGADSLGSRDRRAEEVGILAARKLIAELQSGMALDSHLADMMIPLAALAEGHSEMGVSDLTPHSKTMMWLCTKMLGTEFKVELLDGRGALVSVEGKPHRPG